ncbi:MAG: ABC transporter substrate-binding protein [Acidiferrobacterales bacterium]
MTQINIMVTRHSAFYSPLISTITGGFLKQEGLEPTYAIATPQKSVRDGIRDGSIHLGQSAVSSSWGLMERGETSTVVHFAQINERDGFFITARDPDPDFKWNKMIGKRVLVDHATQPLVMFKYAAHKMSVHYDQLDVIDVGGVDAIDKAFRAGQGDYVHQQGPAPQQLEKDGVGYVVASVGEAIGPVAFSSVIASREWLQTDMAKAFMGAYRKARSYVNETPAAEIARAEADFFKGIDHDVLTTTIAFYQHLGCWNPDPRIVREAYDVALDVFLHSGIITKRHPYEAVVALPPDEA